MNKTTFDLTNLLTKFSLLFRGDMDGGEGLSAFFVLLLLIIAGLFLAYAVYGYFSATKKIRFFRDLLAEVEQNELAGKQKDLLNRAL